MPPKKTKGTAKKSKKKSDGGDELEQKYRRSVLDVAVLKEHLVLRKEAARQAQACGEELKSRMRGLVEELSEEKAEKKDISADLTRQCKSLKTELGVKVHKLETDITTLRDQLAKCQEELKMEKEARVKMEQEKDASISELKSQLKYMEDGYQRILHDSLDSLLAHLAEARLRWTDKSTAIHQEHKELLSSFGLNPLHL
ncbi:coiled-coil domain-containing protein 153 [Conger conger]|uniref:coiled-coil domain-containing protein 153 n=1 Tax=Conger conger TaxID=82655 RepID=UPI002A598D91|nr:coiled-coil domain-containing protein 153 [Conger conger]